MIAMTEKQRVSRGQKELHYLWGCCSLHVPFTLFFGESVGLFALLLAAFL